MSGLLYAHQAAFLPPGQLPSVESIEQDLTSVVWNRHELMLIGTNRLISGAARDVGNTGFDEVLRPGLLLTKDANDKFVEWGSVTSYAADKIQGILMVAQRVTRGQANQDRFLGYIYLGGPVKEKGIIRPGNTSAGIVGDAQETNIRTQMKYAFRFDDDPLSHLAS